MYLDGFPAVPRILYSPRIYFYIEADAKSSKNWFCPSTMNRYHKGDNIGWGEFPLTLKHYAASVARDKARGWKEFEEEVLKARSILGWGTVYRQLWRGCSKFRVTPGLLRLKWRGRYISFHRENQHWKGTTSSLNCSELHFMHCVLPEVEQKSAPQILFHC